MKLYKYRSTSDPESIESTCQIILRNRFWCSRPAPLNDKKEFSFKYDYTPTDATTDLLSRILIRYANTPVERAQHLASQVIAQNRLQNTIVPIMERMISQFRSELGLACFSSTPDNPTLWRRYGGKGNGICIEVDVPDILMNRTFFKVQYVAKKIFHVDSMFESALSEEKKAATYRNALLTKQNFWKSEEEIRMVTTKQDVNMGIEGSRITQITFGNAVLQHIERDIIELIGEHCATNGISIARIT